MGRGLTRRSRTRASIVGDPTRFSERARERMRRAHRVGLDPRDLTSAALASPGGQILRAGSTPQVEACATEANVELPQASAHPMAAG